MVQLLADARDERDDDGPAGVGRPCLERLRAIAPGDVAECGVLIGTTQGMQELAACADAVLTLDDLSQDLPVLTDIFAM
jgi:hypothetical protein